MIAWLKRWKRQRRTNKKLANKYAKESLRMLNVECRMLMVTERMMFELLVLEDKFQRRHGLRDYIT
jgi:hypothetical protein